eukprot:gnl/Chilomastix_cuspidata/1023.p1 GENE.gnl/Chilomastix_cuspidata/1023~~gnl/Chilomastix_cuspidata/1023.p1  ORF type:complete len:794 (-),score=353.47 gnl/Chilomastix_cuspidata/1023:622-3003(-)
MLKPHDLSKTETAIRFFLVPIVYRLVGGLLFQNNVGFALGIGLDLLNGVFSMHLFYSSIVLSATVYCVAQWALHGVTRFDVPWRGLLNALGFVLYAIVLRLCPQYIFAPTLVERMQLSTPPNIHYYALVVATTLLLLAFVLTMLDHITVAAAAAPPPTIEGAVELYFTTVTTRTPLGTPLFSNTFFVATASVLIALDLFVPALAPGYAPGPDDECAEPRTSADPSKLNDVYSTREAGLNGPIVDTRAFMWIFVVLNGALAFVVSSVIVRFDIPLLEVLLTFPVALAAAAPHLRVTGLSLSALQVGLFASLTLYYRAPLDVAATPVGNALLVTAMYAVFSTAVHALIFFHPIAHHFYALLSAAAQANRLGLLSFSVIDKILLTVPEATQRQIARQANNPLAQLEQQRELFGREQRLRAEEFNEIISETAEIILQGEQEVRSNAATIVSSVSAVSGADGVFLCYVPVNGEDFVSEDAQAAEQDSRRVVRQIRQHVPRIGFGGVRSHVSAFAQRNNTSNARPGSQTPDMSSSFNDTMEDAQSSKPEGACFQLLSVLGNFPDWSLDLLPQIFDGAVMSACTRGFKDGFDRIGLVWANGGPVVPTVVKFAKSGADSSSSAPEPALLGAPGATSTEPSSRLFSSSDTPISAASSSADIESVADALTASSASAAAGAGAGACFSRCLRSSAAEGRVDGRFFQHLLTTARIGEGTDSGTLGIRPEPSAFMIWKAFTYPSNASRPAKMKKSSEPSANTSAAGVARALGCSISGAAYAGVNPLSVALRFVAASATDTPKSASL